ncbi:hypothetical protein EDD86DRAFT_198147 [Gorgonomyces haynaldii]|nr:hypothetical protein EDD86DRAFT_198147 [Gorgonomyces haynaldii]
MTKTLVIGGGIGGLSVCHYLPRHHKITLLESDRLGGWIQSLRNQYLMELGPRTLRPTWNTLDLVHELGISDQVLLIPKDSVGAQNRYILYNNKLELVPNSLIGMLRSQSPLLKNVLSRAMLEPFQKRGPKYESVHDFVSRRLGPALSNRMVSAVMHGIYAGDHTKLEIQSVLPSLSNLELHYGSITRGIFKKPFKPPTVASSPEARQFIQSAQKASIYSFKDGMETIVKALEKSLKSKGVEIRYQKCTKIDPLTGTVQIQTPNGTITEQYDQIVSAVPAHALSQMLDGTLSTHLQQLSFVTVAVVNLVFEGDCLKNPGFGFLVPITEKTANVIGVVFDSSAIPGQDNGKNITRLTAMMGGHMFSKLEGKSEQELLDMALEDVKKHLGITNRLIESKVTIQEKCIPQYHVGHQEWLKQLDELLKNTRLSCIGASYRGVSINDVILDAKHCVKRFA